MTKQKEIGYEIGNIVWHNLEGYQELWNKADFDTKEKIVNEQGKLAIKLVLSLVNNNRELLTEFAIFMVENLERGKTPTSLVNDFYDNIGTK